ncbi:hypothetical protein Spb1_39680 [Planctopirus ephydatiae]|uniref:Uncharacterized protein n=1 Tax=Planctopirus ephydatiae TaxID=2528019 RepID=A0A518GTW6_9PLAN|nr:hypothetical protein Spb1_39680 [Planctopirus ephydatiae]
MGTQHGPHSEPYFEALPDQYELKAESFPVELFLKLMGGRGRRAKWVSNMVRTADPTLVGRRNDKGAQHGVIG